MSKHTPGPWVVITDASGVEVGLFVATTPGYHPGSGFADAALIAATPSTAAERDRLRALNAELLDTLDRIATRLEESAGGGRTVKSRKSLRDAARAAIAKARGEA